MLEDKNTSKTELRDLGEFALIDYLTKDFKLNNDSTLLGIGDDSAIVKHGKNPSLISTDLLIEGIQFDLSYMPLKHLGYKAIIVNLSDVYAMNAYPKQILVSITVSNRFSLEAIDQIYKGIQSLSVKNFWTRK